MQDATTLVFNLTYIGTLAIAALMFLGQLIALAALAALATSVQVLTHALKALCSRTRKNLSGQVQQAGDPR